MPTLPLVNIDNLNRAAAYFGGRKADVGIQSISWP